MRLVTTGALIWRGPPPRLSFVRSEFGRRRGHRMLGRMHRPNRVSPTAGDRVAAARSVALPRHAGPMSTTHALIVDPPSPRREELGGSLAAIGCRHSYATTS